MSINIIVAKSLNNVIGKDGKIPWHQPEDMACFKELTEGSTVIMGRKTWESLPGKLKNRVNVVVSSNHTIVMLGSKQPDFLFSSLESALERFKFNKNVFIIGGARLYAEALPLADYMYMTIVKDMVEGDTFFPEWEPNKWRLEYCNTSENRQMLFKKYRRK